MRRYFEFRWNDWNIDHIADHNVAPEEAEYVIRNVRQPWPEKIGSDKWRVWGTTPQGRYLQVIFIFSPADVVFVIHSQDLTEGDKKQYRRRRR